jgi:hypothetical protein
MWWVSLPHITDTGTAADGRPKGRARKEGKQFIITNRNHNGSLNRSANIEVLVIGGSKMSRSVNPKQRLFQAETVKDWPIEMRSVSYMSETCVHM